MQKKKMSPRSRFILETDFLQLKAYAWDAMQLASTHDPDHDRCLKYLLHRVSILERQMERIGAPQYRTVYKGKPKAR